MPMTMSEIHKLEVREDYPAAINALEDRVRADPSDHEAVIRLGFNLWYAVVEELRIKNRLPVERYAVRFMELFHAYRSRLEDDADFCWAFGLGISMFWYYFPGADEAIGMALLARAKQLDPFYAHMQQQEMARRFRGRGIFASYYAIS